MSSKKDIELLSAASNAVVARHLERRFPGVLIQGDTLSTFIDDIDELIAECDTSNIDAAKEIAVNLRLRIEELLVHYERVLSQNAIELPYTKSISDRPVNEL